MKQAETIEKIIEKFAKEQTNLASECARKMIAEEIVSAMFANGSDGFDNNTAPDIRKSSWPNGF